MPTGQTPLTSTARRLTALAAAAAGLALVPAAGAQAASGFTGSCSFKDGALELANGAGAMGAKTTGTFSAPGTCTGDVDGQAVKDVASRFDTKVAGTIGCSSSDATGDGTLKVGDKSIPVDITLATRLTSFTFNLKGKVSGALDGSGDFTSKTNPGDMSQCANSSFKKAAFDATGKTSAAVVSEAAAPSTPSTPSTPTTPAPAAAPSATFQQRQSGKAAAKRGSVRVRCGADTAGSCAVKVLKGSTLLASGSGSVPANGSTVVAAKLTAAGRKALAAGKQVKATVKVTANGKTTSRSVTFAG